MRSPSSALHRSRALCTAGLAALGLVTGGGGTTGCGGAKQEPAHVAAGEVTKGSTRVADTHAGLQVAGGYQAWNGEAPAKGCVVRDGKAPSVCSGAARCPVVQTRLAVCDGGVSEVTIAGATVVFGLGQGNMETGFGYWPSGEAARAFATAGSAPRPALDGEGALFLVRVEQNRVVDYWLDGHTLQRRVWDAMAGENHHLMSAGWAGRKLYARLSRGYTAHSRDIVASAEGSFQTRDIGLPTGHWPYPVVPARDGAERALALLYGSDGVGVNVDRQVWLLPRKVSRTAAERDVLLPATAQGEALFAFRSFDGGEAGGIHVLSPKGPLAGTSAVAATDVHLLGTGLAQANDCPQGAAMEGAKARVCTRSESDSLGAALARTGDGRVWVAFVVTTREHRAATSVVCGPPPRCAPGQPCRPTPCETVEKDVHDSVRHELSVVRLAADGSGAEMGIRYELGDVAGVDVLRTLDLAAVGMDLHLAAQAGDKVVVRVQLDTTALRPVRLGGGDVTVTPVELTPEN